MNASHDSKPATRVWYLDILRIAAAFGIVVLHASPLGPQTPDVSSLEWRIVMSFSILFRWCVPVFLMISGSLFLAPQRRITTAQLYKKSVLRVAVSFLFWSGFYALVHCLLTGKGKWTFLNQLLRGHYHMWFLFTILALYMLTPIIRRMTESCEITRYFILLGFVFTFLLPRALSFASLFDIPHADVLRSAQSALAQLNPLGGLSSLYYYVLGHYLHAYPIKTKPRRCLYGAGVAAYILTVEMTIRYSQQLGEPSGYFCDPASLTILCMAAAVFLFAKHAFSQTSFSGRSKRILLRLSASSFGVYLVHPFFIERLQITLPASPVYLIAGMPLLALLIYALSLCVSLILSRIPVLKKTV